MEANKKSKKKKEQEPKEPPKRRPPIIITPSEKVCAIVESSPKPLTTAQIAQETGLPHKKVYRICTPLEKKGLLKKGKKPREKPLFFSLIIRQIMHAGNFNLIDKLNKELPIIIEKYELKDPQMETALHKFFKKILHEYPYYHNSIVSGMERLLRTIKYAKTKDEVLELLGLRPFYPEVCTWKRLKR